MPGDVAFPIARGTAGGFDAREVTDTIKRALASAGLDARSGPMKGVTDTIDQALAAAGLLQRSRRAGLARRDHRRRRAHDRRRTPHRRDRPLPARERRRTRARRRVRFPHLHQSRGNANLQGLRPGESCRGRAQPGTAGHDAARLHADARRLCRRHADECAGRRARLPRRVSRAGAARERDEVLELVSPGRSKPRPRRTRDPRGHRARNCRELRHRRAPHLRRRPFRRRFDGRHPRRHVPRIVCRRRRALRLAVRRRPTTCPRHSRR